MRILMVIVSVPAYAVGFIFQLAVVGFGAGKEQAIRVAATTPIP